MEPRQKLWIERDGRLLLSDYRVRLLRHVRETGSLAQAASRMRLSYRRAWGKIKEIEENLGVPLVMSEAGGAGGGHTRLTPAAEELLARYEAFEAEMQSALARAFAATFGNPARTTHAADGTAKRGYGGAESPGPLRASTAGTGQRRDN